VKKLLLLLFLLSWAAYGETDDVQSVPIGQLLPQIMGFAERPAVHRWRKSTITIRPMIGQISEQNNFNSSHLGLLLDFPGDSFSFQLGFRKIDVTDSFSSRQLALTPFKQPGHAARKEIQIGMKMPLIEGIGSQIYDIIPQSQFVFHGLARLNWHLYPKAWQDEDFTDILQGLFKTEIGGSEYRSIQESSPSALLPSRSRHSIGAGFAVEQYYPIAGGTAFHFSFEAITMFDIHTDEVSPSRWMEYNLGVGYDL